MDLLHRGAEQSDLERRVLRLSVEQSSVRRSHIGKRNQLPNTRQVSASPDLYQPDRGVIERRALPFNPPTPSETRSRCIEQQQLAQRQ